ncbi:MAG: LPP20 family lipoprotein [Bacteroidales bacterium]|nr:LPP20 family lipoprotein [Bacteroidales bacterium]
MRLLKILPILPLSLLLFGCGGTKKVETIYPPVPAWVQNRPISSTYYVGIGSARKTGDINQIQQTAKQNALADMASDVSVNISSNSLLYAFESNLNLTQDFTSSIKSQAEQDLEGYETVGNYEDQNNYWVYFRLSKVDYQRIKEERKAKAIAKSLDLYDKGLAAEKSGDVRLAFLNLIKALEPLKPYFTDPLQVSYQGQDIYLGNEIFRQITQVLSSIRVEAKNKQISVKQGQQLPLGSTEFKVSGQNGQPINGVALTATYTERPLRNSKVQTDVNGLASFVLDAIRSNKNTETLKATVNLEVIANEATMDFIIRKLFARFRAPEASMNINIVKPVFYINSSELNLDNKLTSPILSESLKHQIIEAGYTVVDKDIDADYRINITAGTQNSGESGTYKKASLNCSISVKDKSNAEVYSRQLENITGTHFDYQMAGIEAYKEAAKKLEYTISREIIDGVTKGKSAY